MAATRHIGICYTCLDHPQRWDQIPANVSTAQCTYNSNPKETTWNQVRQILGRSRSFLKLSQLHGQEWRRLCDLMPNYTPEIASCENPTHFWAYFWLAVVGHVTPVRDINIRKYRTYLNAWVTHHTSYDPMTVVNHYSAPITQHQHYSTANLLKIQQFLVIISYWCESSSHNSLSAVLTN